MKRAFIENAFTIQKADAAGNRYRITATTPDVDRQGERVRPEGITNLAQYLAYNPVILYAHNYYGFPVGKALAGEVNEKALVLEITFAETDLGREVKYLYDNGFLNSFSIGFIPIDWTTGPDEVREFTKWELLEVSAVPVPANGMANLLRSCEERGQKLEAVRKMLDDASSEPEQRPESSDVTAERKGADAWIGLADRYLTSRR